MLKDSIGGNETEGEKYSHQHLIIFLELADLGLELLLQFFGTT